MVWPDAPTVANLIAGGALFVSVLALVVSILAWMTSRRATDIASRAERYDYAVRLQVREEWNDPPPISEKLRGDEVFRYSAKLVNGGLKPVRIERVYFDYGGKTPTTSLHFVADGMSDIPPGGERPISFRLRKQAYEDALTKFGIDSCFVRLRVRYFNADGTVAEAERPLITLEPGRGAIFYAQRGDALT
jgi:hypothetical protein